MNGIGHLSDLLHKSYKKLKSFAYYDKNLVSLKRNILAFEKKVNYDINGALNNFAVEIIKNVNDEKEIWDPKVSYRVYPKKFKEQKTTNIISNNPSKKPVTEIQYFIELDIKSYILSMLWCMTVGFNIDAELSEHAYGNRINKYTAKSRSPFMFLYYPIQYSSWRDKSIEKAESFLREKQPIAYITTDIERFFYNIDFNDFVKNKLLNEVRNQITPDDLNELPMDIRIKLTQHIFSVLDKYKEKTGFATTSMPIGYPPSNILSNFYLKKFDKDVCTKARPDYYGRYVDDMVFVVRLNGNEPDADKGLIEYLNNKLPGLFNNGNVRKDEKIKFGTESFIDITPFDGTEHTLKLNLDKTQIFTFDPNHSNLSLSALKKNIEKNSSEFRYIPDQELLDEDIYTIFKGFSDDRHKPSELMDTVVDKYGLSKFVGKYQRMSAIFKNDRFGDIFRKLLESLDDNAVLGNFSLWEKLLQIAIQIGDIEQYYALISRIQHIIDSSIFEINVNDSIYGSQTRKKMNILQEKLCNKMKKDLKFFLGMCIARTLATYWGPKIDTVIKKIESGVQISIFRKLFCLSRMCDKHTLSVPIDFFISKKEDHEKGTEQYRLTLDDNMDCNLTSFDGIFDSKIDIDIPIMIGYGYYPYMIKMQDICFLHLINAITKGENKLNLTADELKKIYMSANYDLDKSMSDTNFDSIDIKDGPCIKVGSIKYKKLQMAISSTRYPNDTSMRDLYLRRKEGLKQIPDEVKQIINESIRNNADVIVMPECFLPFGLTPYVISFCSKNNICLISGLQHISYNHKTYNISMVTLPYEDMYGQKESVLVFHLKNHYAPKEIEYIRSIGNEAVCGNGYELLCWNDIWFSLCCCYELASICDRSLFKYLVDMKVMVEYNQDVNYFSSIIESLSRDLHCYCIQVNSSYYGDSRITGPMKTEIRDLVKVKGGKNPTVLCETIDVDKLRNFQIDNFRRNEFKPLPPGFDRRIPAMKQNQTLFKYLKSEIRKNKP